MQLTLDQFFSRYKYNVIEDKIGGGSFGSVYKALDNEKVDTYSATGNAVSPYVAIKVSEVKRVGDKVFSLQDEMKAVKNIPQHRNIANYEDLYQFVMPNGIFDYATMQYYPEGSLKDLLSANILTEEQKLKLIRGIISGVDHLHYHKVVHRDLKPANILIEKESTEYVPKIADFGLSKLTGNELTSRFSNSFAAGTLAYSAPEQLLGEELRMNTDLWAVGVILYEIFLKERPFRPSSPTAGSVSREREIYNKIINAPVPIKVNQIPEPYREIVKRCLIKNPENRIKKSSELIDILSNRSSSSSSDFTKTIVDENPQKSYAFGQVEQEDTVVEGINQSPPPFRKPPARPNEKLDKFVASDFWMGIWVPLIYGFGYAVLVKNGGNDFDGFYLLLLFLSFPVFAYAFWRKIINIVWWKYLFGLFVTTLFGFWRFKATYLNDPFSASENEYLDYIFATGVLSVSIFLIVVSFIFQLGQLLFGNKR